MKILTILIPVYNTEKYIKRCLDSIAIEDIIADIEVLVVSDGSKDNAVNIAKSYAEKFPQSIRIIEKENGGHGSTINYGLKEATGKYFRVLDSDDWFDSKNFVEYVKRLKNEDCDLVVTDYSQEHIYKNETIPFEYSKLKDNKVYNFDTMDLDLLKGEYFVMATSTYKTELLRQSKLELFEKTFYVDMQYNFVSVSLVKSIRYYKLDIYKYFIGRKDQSNNSDSLVRNQDNHERVVRFLIDYYTDNFDSFSQNKKDYYKLIIYYTLYTHYSIYCVYEKNYKNAYNKISEFDKYLKNKNPDLYSVSNIDFIAANRKIGFVGTKINGRLFNKLISALKMFRR